MRVFILTLVVLFLLLASSNLVISAIRCTSACDGFGNWPCDEQTDNEACGVAGGCAAFGSKYDVHSLECARGGDCVIPTGGAWYCGDSTYITPEFGVVPSILTFIASLGIPLWLFRKKY